MVDPITVAVITSAMRAAAWETSEALRRSSHSPIIREMYDFSCAIFTAEGETVAQDELIPAFMGTMASTIPFVLEAAQGRDLDQGDAYFTNDPYRGGTHTPDIQLFAPVIADGRVIAWCGNIAHHSDMGGSNPGTEGFANRSIFEEGLRIPPVLLSDRGLLNDPLLRMIETNVRDPTSTAGDLRAQLASARLGQRRVGEIVERYGRETVVQAMAASLAQSERRARAAIMARPDGVASAEGWLDDDGLGGGPVRVAAKVKVMGDRVSVDLTGSDEQMPGGMNMAYAAARAAVIFACKAIFDPDAPQDGGILRAIDAELPYGSVANPRYPAALSLRHLTVQRLTDVLIGAFGELYPDVATAGSFVGFSSLAASCAHPRNGNEVIIQDDLGGGMGAHSAGDGLDAVDVYLGNVQILPAEVSELEYPVRIVSTELVPDSGGAGEFRGGLGIRRTYEFLDTADTVIYTEQTRPEGAPRGLQGGAPGLPARLVFRRADGSESEVTKTRVIAERGDRLIVRTGGGGGFGDPRNRDRTAIERDLVEGKITAVAAERDYGIGLKTDGS